MSDFAPGDTVICVDAKPNPEWLDCPGYSVEALRQGRAYCVDGIDDFGPDSDGDIGLFLVGVPNIPDEFGDVYGWSSHRFRKIEPASPDFIEEIKRVSTPALGARTAVQEVLG